MVAKVRVVGVDMDKSPILLDILSKGFGAFRVLVDLVVSSVEPWLESRTEPKDTSSKDCAMTNQRECQNECTKNSAFGIFGSQYQIGSNEWLQQKMAEAEYRGEKLEISVKEDE